MFSHPIEIPLLPQKSELQLAAKLLNPLNFPHSLDPTVKKLCNIERCGNNMHQMVANMMLAQYLQLQLCSKVYIPLAKTVFFLVFKMKKLKMGQSVTGTNALRIIKYI